MDNALIIGFDKEDTEAAFLRVQKELDKLGLTYHELVPATKELEFVGLRLDLGKQRKVLWKMSRSLQEVWGKSSKRSFTRKMAATRGRNRVTM